MPWNNGPEVMTSRVGNEHAFHLRIKGKFIKVASLTSGGLIIAWNAINAIDPSLTSQVSKAVLKAMGF